ncbi:hypothetical protein [Marinobacter sp. HL-58]|uniref:hypothetical protein n=1 Tax=Marinobacter sp. HL-58 TaxID=1479237 RepID=UPI0012DFA9C9|nr:hypothetical protein [Marinobacter sp. HL-58]
MANGLAARKEGFRPLPIEGFAVPARWQGEQVVLVPAGPEWVAMDYLAVIASRRKLRHLFGPRDTWPPDDLDLAMDEADLAWHAREFADRRSFAYHLLGHDQQHCLGCLYLYPSASVQHDAEAYLWTHSSLDADRAQLIESEVIDWVIRQWPFQTIAWPGRFIPFGQWELAGIPNYYASTRGSEDDPA